MLFVSENLPHFTRQQLYTALMSLKTDSAGAQVAVNGAIHHFLLSRSKGHDWWDSSVDLRSEVAADGADDESALRQALVDISHHKYLAGQLLCPPADLESSLPCGLCTESAAAIPSKTAGSAQTESAPNPCPCEDDDDGDDVSVYSVSTQATGMRPPQLSSPARATVRSRAVADCADENADDMEHKSLLVAGSGTVAQGSVAKAAPLLPMSTRPHREKKAEQHLPWREREGGTQTWTHVGRRKRMRELAQGVPAGNPGTAQKTSKAARPQAEWLPSTDESEAIIGAKCQEWPTVLQKGIVQATALSTCMVVFRCVNTRTGDDIEATARILPDGKLQDVDSAMVLEHPGGWVQHLRWRLNFDENPRDVLRHLFVESESATKSGYVGEGVWENRSIRHLYDKQRR